MGKMLSDIRSDRGASLWLWFAAKLTLGLAQMIGAVSGFVLYLKEGLTSTTMEVFFFVAALTTLSMVLFKLLGWKPVKR